MSNRLGGKQGTAYLGTNANQPPNITYNTRAPGVRDINYSVGDFWIEPAGVNIWILASLKGDQSSPIKGSLATWVQIVDGGQGVAGGWQIITGSQAAESNVSYITNSAGLITLTLPVTSVVGDMIRITGLGTGGWQVNQNAGQTIHFGNQDTTPGIGGSIASTHYRDSITMVCVIANTDWNILDSVGNITVV